MVVVIALVVIKFVSSENPLGGDGGESAFFGSIREVSNIVVRQTKSSALEKYMFYNVSAWTNTSHLFIGFNINETVYTFLKDAYKNPTQQKCNKIKTYLADDYPGITCQQIYNKLTDYVQNGWKVYKNDIQKGVVNGTENRVVLAVSNPKHLDKIRIGEHSQIYEYVNESKIQFQDGVYEINYTLKKKVNGSFVVVNTTWVYWDDDQYKLGANDSECVGVCEYLYEVNTNSVLIEQGFNPIIHGSAGLIVSDFNDVCNGTNNCSWVYSREGFNLTFSSNWFIDPSISMDSNSTFRYGFFNFTDLEGDLINQNTTDTLQGGYVNVFGEESVNVTWNYLTWNGSFENYKVTEDSFDKTDDNLMAWWKFNNDTSIGENETRIYDWSNNKRNLSLILADSSEMPSSDGKINDSWVFDGVDNNNALQYSSNFTDVDLLTVSAWFKTSHDGSDRHIIAFGSETGIWFHDNTNRIRCDFENNSGSLAYADSINPVNDGLWHMVTCAYNGTHVIPYLDGEIQTDIEALTGEIDLNSNPNTYGSVGSLRKTTFETSPWNGTIDEIAVWNRTLNSSEILDIYYFDRLGHANVNVSVDVSAKNNTFCRTFDCTDLQYWYGLDKTSKDYVGDCDGLQVGDMNFSVPGRYEDAVYFNGSGEISISNPGIDYTEGTISAWIKADNYSASDDGLVKIAYSGVAANEWFGLAFRLGIIRLSVDDGLTCGRRESKSVAKFNDSEWHYIVGTFDAGNTMSLYVDGVQVDSDSLAGCEATINPSAALPYTIGGKGGQNYYEGVIDEVKIWNRTLSDTEIKNIYFNHTAGTADINFSSCQTNLLNNTNSSVGCNGRWLKTNVKFRTNDSNVHAILTNMSVDYTNISYVTDLNPNVNIVQPENHSRNTTIPTVMNFVCNGSDDLYLDNLSLYLTDNNNATFELNQSHDMTGSNGTAGWNVTLNSGLYSFNCRGVDNSSQETWSTNRTFFIGTGVWTCENLTEANTEYTLENNITKSGSCIHISNHNISLDLQQYAIDGFDTGNAITVFGFDNTTILNGLIDDFANGISLSHTENTNVTHTKFNSIFFSGIDMVNSSKARVANISSTNTEDQAIGILAGNSSTFSRIQLNATADSGVDGSIRVESSSHNRFLHSSFNTTQAIVIGVIVDSLNNTFLNSSYDTTKENSDVTSELIRSWYYRAYVNDSDGNVVGSTNITAYNVSGSNVLSVLTDSNGWIDIQEITDYYNQNGIRTYWSNYTIQANKTGYNGSQTSINISLEQSYLNASFTLAVLDTTLPNIVLNYPLDSDTITSPEVSFNATITDNLAIMNVSLWTNETGEWNITSTNTSGANSIDYIFIETPYTEGTYYWNVEACDTAGNCNTSQANRTFTVLYDVFNFSLEDFGIEWVRITW